MLESQKRLYEGLIYYEDPEALRTFQELERVGGRLSTLAFSQPGKGEPWTPTASGWRIWSAKRRNWSSSSRA
ncbi:MAG: hypothetical protein MZV70_35575 [Desulfobacterales bacterium]|nr:hypothetical protein [Desulfobacterales bacterium]